MARTAAMIAVMVEARAFDVEQDREVADAAPNKNNIDKHS
jgi:hypothetical protein